MARFTEGWIRIDRRAVEEDIGNRAELLAIWITLLVWANRFESKIIWNDTQRTLPPGTIVTGMQEIASKLSIPKTNVYRWVRYLEKRNSLRTESGTRGTIITICNYSQYQLSHESSGTQPERNLERERNASGTPTERERTLNGQEYNSTIQQLDPKKKSVGIRTNYPQEFQEIWDLYGRRGDKKAALEEWRKINPSQIEIAMLQRSIDRYVKNNPDLMFRKHLCRYLKTDWREVEPVLQNGNGKTPNWMQEAIDEPNSGNEGEAAHG